MKFVIQCLDKAGSDALRQSIRAEHVGYVDQFAEHVVLSGPLYDEAQRVIGSLFVMEFDDIAEAEAFNHEDPFTKAGLFRDVTIRSFKQIRPS